MCNTLKHSRGSNSETMRAQQQENHAVDIYSLQVARTIETVAWNLTLAPQLQFPLRLRSF